MGTRFNRPLGQIQLAAPSGGVTVDVPEIIGTMFVVPLNTALEGELVAGYTLGNFTLPKATGFAPSAGDAAYWDNSLKKLSSDTTKYHIGKYSEAAGSSATEAEVDVYNVQGSDAELQAVQTGLTDHTGDTSAAHAASAISIADAESKYTATDAEAALTEVMTAVTDHTGDTSAAHAASAISIADAGGKFTATDVEAALAELEARVDALEGT